MTATASLTPYLNPPDAHRARAVIMSDDAGEVQVIAQESALVNLESLSKATTRQLRPLPYDVGAPTAAIPGHYDLPVIVDQALTQARELALATIEPGGYVRARGEDLLSGHADTRVVAFTDPLGSEPTTASKAQDTQQIHSAIGEFTTLRIQERLDQTLHIPPLPEAARKIVALHADPNYELKDLVAIIETDPSMAARIMGWANSAFYHVDPPARSIDDAVMRVLGFDTVMSMALGLALGQTLRLPEDQVRGLPPYWLDAVFTAATTEALARRMPADLRPNTGLCYLAGLLANFGTLVLGHVFPPHYQKICKLQEANRHLPHTYIDQYVLKLPREVLATTLLELWGVPQEAVDAIRYQYVPDYHGSNATYVQLLHLARQALGAQGITDYPPVALEDDDIENLGLTGTALSSVLRDINDSREELDSFAAAL
ncbi:MAG: HDOD domain-containing protein [Gammaproteobacteria bacterium]|nr:HDOD domain-containing protein [Gammaproteobacteria bacterium]